MLPAGAATFGALAIGVLAIGRLAVGRLVIKKARFNELEVGDLTVHRLRVVEHKGPGSWCRRPMTNVTPPKQAARTPLAESTGR